MNDPLYDGPLSDYEDQMEAVREGLLDYDDTHCIHGTFTGGWAGPDYICGYCEDGVTLEEMEANRAYNEWLGKRWARMKETQLKRVAKYNELGANEHTHRALFDSIVRVSIWLGMRNHWR